MNADRVSRTDPGRRAGLRMQRRARDALCARQCHFGIHEFDIFGHTGSGGRSGPTLAGFHQPMAVERYRLVGKSRKVEHACGWAAPMIQEKI